MSLVVSSLTAFVDETGAIINKAVLGARTLKSGIRIEPGIKTSKNLHTLASTVYAQANSTCGWNASGSTSLGATTLTLCPLKINESICIEILEQYYTQMLLKAGSYNETLGGFESYFASEKADSVSALIEELIWQGNPITATGNNKLCGGILYEVDRVVSGSTVNTYTASAITVGSAIATVDMLIAALPAAVRGATDLKLFMSEPNFYTYLQAVRNANYFNPSYFSVDAGSQWEYQHPASNVTVVGVAGLNSTSTRMILTPASNLVFGTDLEKDATDFRLWYSLDNQEERFVAKWKQGVKFIFPDFVVRF